VTRRKKSRILREMEDRLGKGRKKNQVHKARGCGSRDYSIKRIHRFIGDTPLIRCKEKGGSTRGLHGRGAVQFNFLSMGGEKKRE